MHIYITYVTYQIASAIIDDLDFLWIDIVLGLAIHDPYVVRKQRERIGEKYVELKSGEYLHLILQQTFLLTDVQIFCQIQYRSRLKQIQDTSVRHLINLHWSYSYPNVMPIRMFFSWTFPSVNFMTPLWEHFWLPISFCDQSHLVWQLSRGRPEPSAVYSPYTPRFYRRRCRTA